MRKNKPAHAADKQRRENIILAIILALIFAAVIFTSSLAYKTPKDTISYTVKSGDTLWKIAEQYCPNCHTGNVIYKIKQLNNIDEEYIYPGEVLVVPIETETYIATAYTHTGNRTKSGTWPQEGRTIAVDPEVIPIGSQLIINGQGGYIAEDIGGNIKGQRLDIFMDTQELAVTWGCQPVEVVVLE